MAVYKGVPSIRLEGDQKRALAAIPVAKALLQKVQTILDRSGADTFSMSLAYGEDGDIYVLCARDQNIIRITVGEPRIEVPRTPTELPEGRTYPTIMSGLVLDGVLSNTQVTIAGEQRTVKAVNAFTPTPNCAQMNNLSGGRQKSPRLAVRPWTAYSEWRPRRSDDFRDFSQYQIPRPSWWSGKMKRAVQAV